MRIHGRSTLLGPRTGGWAPGRSGHWPSVASAGVAMMRPARPSVLCSRAAGCRCLEAVAATARGADT